MNKEEASILLLVDSVCTFAALLREQRLPENKFRRTIEQSTFAQIVEHAGVIRTEVRSGSADLAVVVHHCEAIRYIVNDIFERYGQDLKVARV